MGSIHAITDPGVLLAEGALARREGRLSDAKDALTKAFAVAQEAAHATLMAQSLVGLGSIERDLGDTGMAREHYQEAVSVYRNLPESLADPLCLAHTVLHVGDIALELNLLDLAGASFQEALDIYHNHPETGTLDLANTLRGFALLKTALADSTFAIALWQEAGELYDQVWQEPGSPFVKRTWPQESPKASAKLPFYRAAKSSGIVDGNSSSLTNRET